MQTLLTSFQLKDFKIITPHRAPDVNSIIFNFKVALFPETFASQAEDPGGPLSAADLQFIQFIKVETADQQQQRTVGTAAGQSCDVLQILTDGREFAAVESVKDFNVPLFARFIALSIGDFLMEG